MEIGVSIAMKSRLVLPSMNFWNNFLIHSLLSETTNEEFNTIIFDDFLNNPLFKGRNIHTYHAVYSKKKQIIIDSSRLLKLNNDNSCFDEIYVSISAPNLKIYNLLASIFTFKKVYFLEESLFSYVRFLVDKNLVNLVNQHQLYLVNYNEAILEAVFKAGVNPQNVVFFKKQDLLNNMLPLQVATKAQAVVLIDSIKENNPNKDFIINEYKSYIKLLVAQNKSVCLRPHIKLAKSIYENLSEFIKPYENVSLEYGKSGVETLALQQDTVVLSSYSTALLSLKFLYDAQIWTSYKLLQKRISFFQFNYMALSSRVIIYLFPDFVGEIKKGRLPNSLTDYVLGKKYSPRWLMNMFVFWYSRVLLERLHYKVKL
ncbi:MAG: hypothetical protein LBQ34_00500 [Alphaproteobacteria bacterium]|jgi:hypothetical protein|nr:hypothetical protein [Alphaproteobacteria bacterium]